MELNLSLSLSLSRNDAMPKIEMKNSTLNIFFNISARDFDVQKAEKMLRAVSGDVWTDALDWIV